MNPNYHTPLTSFPLELKEDHQLMINLNQASSSSPASCHSFFEPVQQQQGGFYHMESHLLQHPEEGKKFFSQAGSCDSPESGSGLKRNENHQCDQNSSVKWMSSKMRLMKKMMNSDAAAANNSYMQKLEDQIQKQPPSSSLETEKNNSYSNNNNTNTNTIIRVCADCNTTKTPLWRGGPKGPKSLCNACGIRQRKARRAAAAAAAAAANGTAVQLAADASSNKKSRVQDKDKTSSPSNNNNSCLPFKKRCKFNSNNSPSHGKKNKLCFEDLAIILSKNSSALQRVFPQDEKEAAILLMALSHGLVHG